MPLKHIVQQKGFVMFHHPTGEIWPESFSTDRNVCFFKAKELWALDGETEKDNPGWRPVKAEQTILITAKTIIYNAGKLHHH